MAKTTLPLKPSTSLRINLFLIILFMLKAREWKNEHEIKFLFSISTQDTNDYLSLVLNVTTFKITLHLTEAQKFKFEPHIQNFGWNIFWIKQHQKPKCKYKPAAIVLMYVLVCFFQLLYSFIKGTSHSLALNKE